jgi:hypothetical protein
VIVTRDLAGPGELMMVTAIKFRAPSAPVHAAK